MQRAQLSSLCSLVIHRVCNTHMSNWITSAGPYNGFLHISAQEYQVETTFDICKCLERQLLFNYKNILESLWHNSDTARRLTNLCFIKENFDRRQFLSIGIYRLEKVLFSLLKTRNGCKKKSVLPTSGVPLVLINSFIMGFFFFFMGGRRIPHLATYSSLDGSSWHPLS